jgi:hypothetical protein
MVKVGTRCKLCIEHVAVVVRAGLLLLVPCARYAIISICNIDASSTQYYPYAVVVTHPRYSIKRHITQLGILKTTTWRATFTASCCAVVTD